MDRESFLAMIISPGTAKGIALTSCPDPLFDFEGGSRGIANLMNDSAVLIIL